MDHLIEPSVLSNDKQLKILMCTLRQAYFLKAHLFVLNARLISTFRGRGNRQ